MPREAAAAGGERWEWLAPERLPGHPAAGTLDLPWVPGHRAGRNGRLSAKNLSVSSLVLGPGLYLQPLLLSRGPSLR